MSANLPQNAHTRRRLYTVPICWLLTAFAAAAPPPARQPGIRFENRASQAGVTFVLDNGTTEDKPIIDAVSVRCQFPRQRERKTGPAAALSTRECGLYNYGRLLMKQGDLAASKIHLDRSVELVPDMRAIWYERARLDLKRKDYQLARKDAEMAASIADPNGLIIDLQVYAILEQIYRRIGETGLANKYAQLGRETPPPVRGEHH